MLYVVLFKEITMTEYKNLSGESGILAYEIGDDFIRVQFQDKEVYVYTNESTGQEHIDEMKRLAEKGRGLNTYINQHVRKKYDRKET